MTYRIVFITLLSLLLVSSLSLTAQETIECDEGFRSFEHELLATDPVCVPENPERIVTLGMPSFETLMALDVPPYASPAPYLRNYALYYPTLADQTEDIQNLGPLAFTSIEAILEAEPDLIIGHEARFIEFYDDLSAIAPTVLYQFEDSGVWKDVAQFVAELVNREAEYGALMNTYNERIEAFRETLANQDTVVSIIRIRPEALRLYVVDSFPGAMVADAGLERPESQQYQSDTMQAEFGQTTFYSVSRESIQLADGDVIFIWTSSPTAALAEQSEARLQELQDDPLWSTLDAVQDGQIYEVGGYWIGSSFVAAHYIIDDLFTYIADTEPTIPNPFIEEDTDDSESTDNHSDSGE